MKVKVISLPYIFQVLYVLCFTRPRYQVSVYRTIGPLVRVSFPVDIQTSFERVNIKTCLERYYSVAKTVCANVETGSFFVQHFGMPFLFIHLFLLFFFFVGLIVPLCV